MTRSFDPPVIRRVRFPRNARRGAMLPLICVLLPVLIVFIGFSVDLAYMQNTRLELRAATDSAARAGATRLSATDDPAEARTEAKNFAQNNPVAGQPLQLRDEDIVIGRSVRDGNGKWNFTAGGSPPNAVRVNGARTAASLDGPVSLFFGNFFGTPVFEPSESATASFHNVDICLVLDRSSSMKLAIDSASTGLSTSDSRFCDTPRSDSRWAALDAAVALFVQALNDTNAREHVALATYSSSEDPSAFCAASTVASTLDAPLSDNTAQVVSAMGNLSATLWNGNTNIEAGIRTGLAELTHPSRSRQYAEKILIVMTDGHENVGDSLAAATDCAAESIAVNTVTFGDFADQDRMQQVAGAASGRHLHAADADELEQAFLELAAQISQLTE